MRTLKIQVQRDHSETWFTSWEYNIHGCPGEEVPEEIIDNFKGVVNSFGAVGNVRLVESVVTTVDTLIREFFKKEK